MDKFPKAKYEFPTDEFLKDEFPKDDLTMHQYNITVVMNDKCQGSAMLDAGVLFTD